MKRFPLHDSVMRLPIQTKTYFSRERYVSVHVPKNKILKQVFIYARYSADTDKLSMSYSRFKQSQLRFPGSLVLKIFSTLGLCDIQYSVGEDGKYMECTNLTIINLAIKVLGPINEGTLTKVLLGLQVSCSIVALVIRYPLAKMFYESNLVRSFENDNL